MSNNKTISELLYECREYTDKNRGKYDFKIGHCYGDSYDDILSYKNKEDKISILEIGVQKGASLKVWKDFFQNSIIYGVDITDERVFKDGYNFILSDVKASKVLEDLEGINFDIIVDDGSHYLSDVIYTVNNFIDKLNVDGVMIIEDVQNPAKWLGDVKQALSDRNDVVVSTRDLRNGRNYDDFMIVIKKIK
jgi:hypothetical protein